MKQYLFPEHAGFYKANLHCHTNLSDGELSPAEVKQAYLAEGYSVVAFTDHEALLDHSDLCDDRFIALNGYETAVKSKNGVPTTPLLPVHHINFIKKKPHDLTQFCFYPANFTPGRCKEHIPFLSYTGELCEYEYTPAFFRHLTAEAHKNGCLVHYNHPFWSLQTAESLAALEGIDGLELCNTGCRAHGDFNDYMYSELLRMGKRMYAVAGDDNHNHKKGMGDSFGAWTVIAAEQFTYEGITDALSNGQSYVSTGPSITSLYVEDGTLVVRTSPAAAIMLRSEGREIITVKSADGYVDGAAFTLEPDRMGSYFRLDIVDKNGNHAYTRAYEMKDMI